MKVTVDRGACTGHGRCYTICPEVYGEDEEGYCLIERPDVPAAHRVSARRAADNCPERAIHVTETTP